MLLYLCGSCYFPDNIDINIIIINIISMDSLGMKWGYCPKWWYWPAAHWPSVTSIKFHRGSTNISMSIGDSQIISNTPGPFLGQNANCPSRLHLAPEAKHWNLLLHMEKCWSPSASHLSFDLCWFLTSLGPKNTYALWISPWFPMPTFGKGPGRRAGCSESVMGLYRAYWAWTYVSLPLVPLTTGQSLPQQQTSLSSPACWNTGQAELGWRILYSCAARLPVSISVAMVTRVKQ